MITPRKLALAKVSRRGVSLLLILTMVWGSVGCGLPRQWQQKADKLPTATPQDPVYSILCIWEPSEGHGPDGKPTRGFAGQIQFFTRRQETPVRVSGDVRVYVYDDQGSPEERGKPIHQWDFLGDAWKVHLHDGTLGPTYSVFIPYTGKGVHQVQCALRVKFTPENGHPIYSDTSAVILPGQLRKKDDGAGKNKSKKDRRTSLDSLTISLKEKRKAQFDNMPLGQSQMNRTVAPVSDLAKRDSQHHQPASLPSPPPDSLPQPETPTPTPTRHQTPRQERPAAQPAGRQSIRPSNNSRRQTQPSEQETSAPAREETLKQLRSAVKNAVTSGGYESTGRAQPAVRGTTNSLRNHGPRQPQPQYGQTPTSNQYHVPGDSTGSQGQTRQTRPERLPNRVTPARPLRGSSSRQAAPTVEPPDLIQHGPPAPHPLQNADQANPTSHRQPHNPFN